MYFYGHTTLYLFQFALSRQTCLFAPYLAFRLTCLPSSYLYIGAKNTLISLLYFDSSAASTPPLFLLLFLYISPQYSLKTWVIALLHGYLLALQATFFQIVSAIGCVPYIDFSSRLGVLSSILGIWCTNVWMTTKFPSPPTFCKLCHICPLKKSGFSPMSDF